MSMFNPIKEKKIRLIRPFVKLEEGAEYRPCFIGYAKVPWVFQNHHHEDGRIEGIVVQYRKRLYINLWFVEFYFSWLTPSSLSNND